MNYQREKMSLCEQSIQSRTTSSCLPSDPKYHIIGAFSVASVTWETQSGVSFLPTNCVTLELHKEDDLFKVFRYNWRIRQCVLMICADGECVCILSCFSSVWFFVTLWTVEACQAPLSRGFSRQEHWNGLLCPSSRDLAHLGIEPASPTLQADSLSLTGKHGFEKALLIGRHILNFLIASVLSSIKWEQ